jgi:hypothetical protein
VEAAEGSLEAAGGVQELAAHAGLLKQLQWQHQHAGGLGHHQQHPWPAQEYPGQAAAALLWGQMLADVCDAWVHDGVPGQHMLSFGRCLLCCSPV